MIMLGYGESFVDSNDGIYEIALEEVSLDDLIIRCQDTDSSSDCFTLLIPVGFVTSDGVLQDEFRIVIK